MFKPTRWIRERLHDGSIRAPHPVKGIVGTEMAQEDQHSLPARLAILDEQNARKIELYHLETKKRAAYIQQKKFFVWTTPFSSSLCRKNAKHILRKEVITV